jgi:hypothetical protein
VDEQHALDGGPEPASDLTNAVSDLTSPVCLTDRALVAGLAAGRTELLAEVARRHGLLIRHHVIAAGAGDVLDDLVQEVHLALLDAAPAIRDGQALPSPRATGPWTTSVPPGSAARSRATPTR